jgi:hypothetical protein
MASDVLRTIAMRNATLFAIFGTALWTIVLAIELLRSLSGLGRGIVAADSSLATVIHFLFALSLLVFFLVFHRSQ